MSKGPGLFADIGKKAKDLLTRDYISDQKFTVSTYSDTGVVGIESLTIYLRQQLNANYCSLGHHINCSEERRTLNWRCSSAIQIQNSVIDVKADTGSNINTTLTFTEIIPSTKTIASFKFPDYNSGKLEVQYFHDHATLTTSVALNQSPAVDLSVTIGTPSIAFGAEAGYDTTSGCFTKYTAGISVAKPDSCASIILGDKGDTIRASYVHHLDSLKKSAAVGEISRRFSTNDNTFTVGGSYAIDPLTNVKAKLNNHGNLGALLQHEIIPKSILTLSGEFDTKALDKTPRFGLALALKP
ncbi:Mitochondrial outer membrane protein porin 2 [Vitis vinifera]|uniref:Mitochondrial outer membrane protein porin 2 n=1 Tax=Vitis vinifera TaxID=29760 RepID=A0A438KQ38_VITVI|nr:Mitochondrial outer membrane protein porin 2 [Vitis vinifera]